METADKFIFKSFDNIKNIMLTQCSLSEEPDVVVAIMGEDVPQDFEDPLFLGNKYVVALPQIIVGYAKEVTVWLSKEVPPEIMSSLIQEYFDAKFPNVDIDESTSMGLSEAGKIRIIKNS